MTGGLPREAEAPDWEVIVSHHLPNRCGRTLVVHWGARRVHLCARCSGQVLGAFGFLLLYFASAYLPFDLFAPMTQVAFAIAPLPAAFDWLTQALNLQESTNRRRVASGMLLGVAWTDALLLLLTARWTLLLEAGGVVCLYLAIILGVLRASGRWRGVLDEHFPGWERSA